MKNAYFEKVGKAIDEYQKKVSDGEKVEFPFNAGTCKAYRAYTEGNDVLVMKEFLWENEIADFVDALRAAGFESFILADIRSTASMDVIFGLVENGCVMTGLVNVIRPNRWGTEKLRGIKFTVEGTK